MGGIGEQNLTVGAQDVFGQCRAAPRVVDAAQHVAAECSRGHRGEHVGGIAQQRTDMQRAVGFGDADQRGGRGRRVGQVLTPGPHPIAVFHGGRGVAASCAK